MYVNAKAIKQFIKARNRQISKDAILAIDRKVEVLLINVTSQFNGHRIRIDEKLINIFKI